MLLGGVLSACAQQENITSVDAAAFQKAITKDSVQLLDVRTAEEYGERHILYAVNIDVLQPGFKEKAEKVLDPSKLVYVYCRSGKRSMTAAKPQRWNLELSFLIFKIEHKEGMSA